LTGKWLGTRPIRCNWATKTNNSAQADETNNGGHGAGMNGAVDPLAGLQSLGQGVPRFSLNNIPCSSVNSIQVLRTLHIKPLLCLICSESSRDLLLSILSFDYRLAEVRPEDRQEGSAGDGPENNPQYTTVYVGNLAHEVLRLCVSLFY